jgi:hypothetical protein
VNLTRAVRRQNDTRRLAGPDGAEFGNGDLELGQQLEEIPFELFVRAVDLVDQEHGRARARRIDRLQQRPFDQEGFAVQIPPQLILIDRAAGFPYPQLENLPRVVPFVDRVRDVEPFIALEPDQIGVERRRDGRRKRGLADAGFTFEEERAVQAQRQEDGNGEAVVGDVMLRGQTLLQVLDGAAEDADLPRGA